MDDQERRSLFKKYLDAFAAESPAEQEALLRASVSDDVVYTNPGVEGSGRVNLLAHIAVFQRRFPGGHFRINWLRQQHGQVLSEWIQIAKDGTQVMTAHSYARLNDRGQIAHLAGFWQPGAV